MDTARAKVVGMQARARDTLIKFHQPLAFFEAPEERRDRSDIETERADAEKMVQDSGDLRIKHPDILRSGRRRNPHQLLYSEREGMLLAHRRYVVEPVEVRNGLQVGLVFDEFFGPAMQQANMRIS